LLIAANDSVCDFCKLAHVFEGRLQRLLDELSPLCHRLRCIVAAHPACCGLNRLGARIEHFCLLSNQRLHSFICEGVGLSERFDVLAPRFQQRRHIDAGKLEALQDLAEIRDLGRRCCHGKAPLDMFLNDQCVGSFRHRPLQDDRVPA
jgi:hypothetical protein